MILFVSILEKHVKIGAVKMAFAQGVSAIVIQVTQDKIVLSLFVLPISFMILQLIPADQLVLLGLIKTFIQELVYLAAHHVSNVQDILTPVRLANPQ